MLLTSMSNMTQVTRRAIHAHLPRSPGPLTHSALLSTWTGHFCHLSTRHPTVTLRLRTEVKAIGRGWQVDLGAQAALARDVNAQVNPEPMCHLHVPHTAQQVRRQRGQQTPSPVTGTIKFPLVREREGQTKTHEQRFLLTQSPSPRPPSHPLESHKL